MAWQPYRGVRNWVETDMLEILRVLIDMVEVLEAEDVEFRLSAFFASRIRILKSWETVLIVSLVPTVYRKSWREMASRAGDVPRWRPRSCYPMLGRVLLIRAC